MSPQHSSTAQTPREFDLRALLDAERSSALPLLEEYVNPAYAAVLKTIGFDARYMRGQGAYLYDDQNRRYIDCLGGYAVFAAGRNHPVIRAALKQAMDMDLPSLPGVGTFRVAGLLARELVKLAPRDDRAGGAGEALDTCYFASGGGEAIDAAIKHARAATGRDRIVYCHRGYHGLTFGAMSVTGNDEFRAGFGGMLNTTEIPFCDCDALERELAQGDVAAFIVEPIQGKGVNLPGADDLQRASALCRRFGALMILDEIQTGLGRTGLWWGGEHFGMSGPSNDYTGSWIPDILVCAKALSGGYVPTSAVLTSRRVHSRVFPSMNHCSRIQNTFSMNDLSMVAGLATLHVLRTEKIIQNAAAVGEHLMSGLRSMVRRHPLVKDVRGRGLMIAIEFARPESNFLLKQAWDMLHTLDPSLFCQAIILPLMSDHRVLAQVAGHRLDVIKLIPPLVLSKADADEVIKAMDVCIANCHTFPGPAWEVGKKLGSAAVRRFGPAQRAQESVAVK